MDVRRRWDEQVIGTNTWEMDVADEDVIKGALRFTDEVEAEGVALLREAWIAPGQKMLWCLWNAEDLDFLQESFEKLNESTGLMSELQTVESFYPE